jgi:hypothetical protein
MRRNSDDDTLNWSGNGVLESVPRRITSSLAERVNRRGVARRADATRHHAGDHTMILPSVSSCVQGSGRRWRCLAHSSSPSAHAMAGTTGRG